MDPGDDLPVVGEDQRNQRGAACRDGVHQTVLGGGKISAVATENRVGQRRERGEQERQHADQEVERERQSAVEEIEREKDYGPRGDVELQEEAHVASQQRFDEQRAREGKQCDRDAGEHAEQGMLVCQPIEPPQQEQRARTVQEKERPAFEGAADATLAKIQSVGEHAEGRCPRDEQVGDVAAGEVREYGSGSHECEAVGT